MNILIAVIIKDIKIMINKSFALVSMLLLPLIFMAILLFNFSDVLYKKVFMEPFSVMVWDKDDSNYSGLLISQFEQLKVFKTTDVVKDENTANTFIKKGYAALIIIPANFIHLTSIGKNPPLEVIANSSMPYRGNLVKNLVHTATNYVTAGQSSLNTTFYFKRELGFTKTELDSSFKNSLYTAFIQVLGRNEAFENLSLDNEKSLNAPISIVAACLTLFIGFSGIPVVKILLDEKINKISLRLKSAQVSLLISFFSKFFITLLISVFQILILCLCATKLFNIELDIDLFNFIAVIIFGVFAFSGFSTFISIISNSFLTADILGNLSLFLMALCSGCFYPIYSLPESIRNIGHYTIHSQVMNGFVRVFTNSSSSSLSNCIILIIIGILFYASAFYTVKYKELT